MNSKYHLNEFHVVLQVPLVMVNLTEKESDSFDKKGPHVLLYIFTV